MLFEQRGDPRTDGGIVPGVQDKTRAPAARRSHGNGTLRTKSLHHCAANHPGSSDYEHNASCQLQIPAVTLT
ncbi:hypothetical protein ABIB45_003799 [Arthrobacter sp. UYCo732]